MHPTLDDGKYNRNHYIIAFTLILLVILAMMFFNDNYNITQRTKFRHINGSNKFILKTSFLEETIIDTVNPGDLNRVKSERYNEALKIILEKNKNE